MRPTEMIDHMLDEDSGVEIAVAILSCDSDGRMLWTRVKSRYDERYHPTPVPAPVK